MAKKILHKYHRIKVANQKVWGCALPDCTHYMPKHMEDAVLGKQSICWQCNETFILDSEAMKEDKPRCINCHRGINPNEDTPDILAFMESLKTKVD